MPNAKALSALLLLCLSAVQPATRPNAGDPNPTRENVPYKQQVSATGTTLSAYETDRCKLDIFMPADVSKPVPVVVWFYGGALEGGEKAGERRGQALKAVIASGSAFVAVNYRLSPKATYPAYVDDAAAATAWVVKHASDIGVDPAKVFVSGHSAGGYLCLAIAYDESFLAKYGVKTSQLAGTIPISPQCFTHYTIRKERKIPDSGLTPVIDEAAPAYHARKDAPPTLVFWGSKDLVTRPEECKYFVALLGAKKHPDAHGVEVEGRDHGSIVGHMSEPRDPVGAPMLEFIAGHKSQP